jgi:hypothetical protein
MVITDLCGSPAVITAATLEAVGSITDTNTDTNIDANKDANIDTTA